LKINAKFKILVQKMLQNASIMQTDNPATIFYIDVYIRDVQMHNLQHLVVHTSMHYTWSIC